MYVLGVEYVLQKGVGAGSRRDEHGSTSEELVDIYCNDFFFPVVALIFNCLLNDKDNT